MTTPISCRKCISLTLVVEVLQVTADVDADVLHFHVLQTGKLVHVLQQPVILASSWTCKDMGRICMREKKTERYRSKYENECISKSPLWLGIYRFYCGQVKEEKIKLCAICCKKKPVSSPCRKTAIFSNISVHSSSISGSAGSTASSAVSTPPSPEHKH